MGIIMKRSGFILGVTNQKGGVGKTTTTVNLGQAFALLDLRVLVVDVDPQGNATQALGIAADSIQASTSHVIRDRNFDIESAIYKGDRLDIIPATPELARVEREMVGQTNSEMRLAQKLRGLRDRYSIILLDSPPTFGCLLNSVLNAADELIVPVDCGVFALHGIKSLLGEIEEIRLGTNPGLKILGLLLTLSDTTNISGNVFDSLVENFGDQVLETRIRRSVKLKEAPAFGRTIFHHAPTSSGAEDYSALAQELLSRISKKGASHV